MSRVSGVACDVCEKFVANTDTTPPGWFVVFRSQGDDNIATLKQEPSEVCSPQCLSKLGTQIKQIETTAPAGGEKPTLECPICKKPCKGPQGLAMHSRRAHPDG